MYIEATISVDPSQLTKIGPAKPTKLFAKLAHSLTRGLAATKEEQETFTAVTILQQLNKVLRSMDINDIVRISKDNEVFFEDMEGQKDDFKEAIEHFAECASREDDTSVFNTLTLVLQHSKAGVDYLLDLKVKRTHAVGEHPIRIHLSAFPKNLNAAGDDDGLRKNLESVFASQKSYNKFTANFRKLTKAFVDDLKEAFRRHMKVDDVQSTLDAKIIRPNRRVNSREDMPAAYVNTCDDPAFSNYYGRNDTFLYAWFWADMCHQNDIHCRDCTLVDESGANTLIVGSEGIDAGAGDTMNVDAPMQETGSIGLTTPPDVTPIDTGGGGSWLSSIGETFSGCGGGDGGGDGGSSCSGCGGGCGGGGCGGGQ